VEIPSGKVLATPPVTTLSQPEQSGRLSVGR